MAPMTLRSVERGGAGVTIGAYAAVMQVLGAEKDLDLIAADDPTGRALQDARLTAPRRTTRPITPTATLPIRETLDPRPGKTVKDAPVQTTPGFASARALASLIDAPPAPRSTTRRR